MRTEAGRRPDPREGARDVDAHRHDLHRRWLIGSYAAAALVGSNASEATR